MVEWDLAFEMRNEIPYWLQILTISSEILWDALTESLSTSTPKTRTLCLLLFGIFEELNYIFKRERDFCLIYRNNFDHRENGRTRWMCHCQTWGSAAQVDLFKALSFPHAHKPWNLSVLNLSVMFTLYWKPEDFHPCQGRDSEPGCSLQSTDCWLYKGR